MVWADKLGQLAHNLISLCLKLIVENELTLGRDLNEVARELDAFLRRYTKIFKLLLQLRNAHIFVHHLLIFAEEERRHIARDELHFLQQKLE